jgi:AcrR family transcriptional regulator
MAIKNIQKRQSILEAAYGLFRANGFERTSISAIVAAVGGSKGTIYSHFGSKEGLFVDCMFAVPEHSIGPMLARLHAGGKDMEALLREFGQAFLRLACTPEVVAVRRLMISEAQRAGVGRMFYERFQVFQQEVASFVSACMAQGRLRSADPHVAATQLRLLLEAEVIDPLLLCVIDGPVADHEIRRLADRAVDTFLRAYAPLSAPSPALTADAGVRATGASAACRQPSAATRPRTRRR